MHKQQLKQKMRSIKGDRSITFFVPKMLITDDFPTFGYPTDIACLSRFKRANCLTTDRREPYAQ